jgi:transposase-like protein
MKLQVIKNRISQLSVNEKKDLIMFIKSSYSVFDDYSIDVNACPDCHSNHIVKNGTRKGVQKYVCRDCKKNFNYKTNTVLSKIQKLNKWNEFVEDFISLNITSLKAMSKKLQLSEQTVFNWRHKLLSAIALKTDVKFTEEAIEFDETWLRISRKGRRNMGIEDHMLYRHWRKKQVGDSPYNVKVFFASGRESKRLDVFQSHTGRTSRKNMENYFTQEKFKNISVFSDAHVTYKSFFRANNIPHETFIGKNHVNFLNKEVHNQTVNAFIRGFKYFVNEHLRGVSTKYLEFYIKWYQFIQESKNQIQKKEELKFDLTNEVCGTITKDNFGIELYRQSELSFIQFLKNNGRTNHGDCKHHYYANKMAA